MEWNEGNEWEKRQDFIFNNVLQCNWSILTMIDAVIAKQDDMSPFQTRIEKLEGLSAALQEQWNCTKMTWEESPECGKDPSLLVILDSLLATLERAVDTRRCFSVAVLGWQHIKRVNKIDGRAGLRSPLRQIRVLSRKKTPNRKRREKGCFHAKSGPFGATESGNLK